MIVLSRVQKAFESAFHIDPQNVTIDSSPRRHFGVGFDGTCGAREQPGTYFWTHFRC